MLLVAGAWQFQIGYAALYTISVLFQLNTFSGNHLYLALPQDDAGLLLLFLFPCLRTDFSFRFLGKNMLIIGNFMPIINTFLPIYKKLFIVQKQKIAF